MVRRLPRSTRSISLTAIIVRPAHRARASASGQRRATPLRPTRFVAVAFPDEQMQILPYNRVVKDLAGTRPRSLVGRASIAVGPVTPGSADAGGARAKCRCYLDGRWYSMQLPQPAPGAALPTRSTSRCCSGGAGAAAGVGDPRTDKRIDFVGGIRGTAELERLVPSGPCGRGVLDVSRSASATSWRLPTPAASCPPSRPGSSRSCATASSCTRSDPPSRQPPFGTGQPRLRPPPSCRHRTCSVSHPFPHLPHLPLPHLFFPHLSSRLSSSALS